MPVKPFLRFFVSIFAAFSLAALAVGCGSEPLGDYQQRVGEINRESAELLAEAAHLMEESGQDGHGEAASIEELVEELRVAALELSRVKVPEGLEGFQEDLLALYGGTVSALEVLLSTLRPVAVEGGSGHAEETATKHTGGEESAHEEETSLGEESAHEEEMTTGHEKEATGEEPHPDTGH